MSLTAQINRLQREWNRIQRHRPPWDRWAGHSPDLDLPAAELLSRLVHDDREIYRPHLAALVELAQQRDRDATLLATLSVMPHVISRHSPSRGDAPHFDEIPGALWAAILTAPNPHIRTLRESLRRTTWRTIWSDNKTRSNRSEQLGLDADIATELDHACSPGGQHDEQRTHQRPSDDTEDTALTDIHLQRTLRQLTERGQLTPGGRRILEQIAAGTHHPETHRDRKQRWRTTSRLRAIPELHQALTA